MTRLQPVDPTTATGKTKELFNAVQGKLGVVPNMMRTMANSPAVLEGYLNLSGALSHGILNARTGELIALTVGESNSCDYCIAAHNFIGEKLLKTDPAIILAARKADSQDSKTKGILQFAKALIDKNGRVNDQDVNAAKDAGITEGEITEIVAHVALNVLTNYLNNTANTNIDFPEAAKI